jgi:hypothetical protein
MKQVMTGEQPVQAGGGGDSYFAIKLIAISPIK